MVCSDQITEEREQLKEQLPTHKPQIIHSTLTLDVYKDLMTQISTVKGLYTNINALHMKVIYRDDPNNKVCHTYVVGKCGCISPSGKHF